MKIETKKITITVLKLDFCLVKIMDMLNINGVVNFKSNWTAKELLSLPKNKDLNELIDYLQSNHLISSDDNLIQFDI